MNEEFRAALFLAAFHAKLRNAAAQSPGRCPCTPADHEISAAEAADAAEKGLAAFTARFGEVP